MARARFSYPDDFREPAPERQFTGQIVEIVRTFDPPAIANEIRHEYGECLMIVRAEDGTEFPAFETELEPVDEAAL